MRILVCPDKFKGCATAPEAAAALARGVRRGWPEAVVGELPLADGGEGTVEALVAATGGETVAVAVSGPLGERVVAPFGLLGDGQTAVVEMAAASGLVLLRPAQRDPRITSTAGTGQLIAAALDRGARRLIVGIGGSATNDGGAGMATALGARLLDEQGEPLPPGGAALARLAHVDLAGLDPRLRDCEVRVACDVDNPLTGPRGASAVYGPQKGASAAVVTELDAALAHYAGRLNEQLGLELAELPGAGAAGGLGAGLVAFCGARLTSGIDLVLDAVGFEARLAETELVLTGEGRLDAQTMRGKTIAGVLRRAAAAGVPVVAVAGAVETDPARLYAAGLAAVVGLPPRPMSLPEALAEVLPLLEESGESIARLARLGQSL